jgi:HAD superfamily hydrolase (TIGR01509 family)
MTLKAVLFDLNGVIINDDPLQQQLIDQVLIEENLRPQPGEFSKLCLGLSDRACLRDLLTCRGRVVSESYLTQLLKRKAKAYQQELEKLEKLPLYPGLEDLIFQMRSRALKLAVVSGSMRSEVEVVLNRANLAEYFTVIVGGDDIPTSKREPDGYILAVERLNQQYSDLNLQASDCLVIEDTLTGIEAAKRAGMPVVGVAHTYPFHMLQRQANWTVDYLCDLEIDRMRQVYAQAQIQQQVGGTVSGATQPTC